MAKTLQVLHRVDDLGLSEADLALEFPQLARDPVAELILLALALLLFEGLGAVFGELPAVRALVDGTLVPVVGAVSPARFAEDVPMVIFVPGGLLDGLLQGVVVDLMATHEDLELLLHVPLGPSGLLPGRRDGFADEFDEVEEVLAGDPHAASPIVWTEMALPHGYSREEPDRTM